MSNIIKRRPTSRYLQLHNHPVQEDLDDLTAIGLLTYMMSLPEDWVLHKTFLQNKFSRRKVDGAWTILSEKKYIIGFIVYIERKKNYYYNVSDIPFTEDEYLQFVDDTLKEVLEETSNVSSLKEMPESPFQIPDVASIVQNVQQSTEQNVQYTTEQIVQYKKYSSICTVQSVHIQNNNKQTSYKQKNNNKQNNIVNLQEGEINKFLNQNDFRISLTNAVNSFYTEFAPTRWSKQAWITLVNKFVEETVNNQRHLTVPEEKILGYAYQSIKGIASKHDLKFGKKIISFKASGDSTVPFYDWLNQVETVEEEEFDDMPY